MVTNQLSASAFSFGTAANELLVAILDQSADCIKVISVHGNVEYMNRAGLCAMEIDDFSAIAGQAWTALWPSEASSKIEQAMGGARAGKLSCFEANCPTAKGSPRLWEVSVSPLCRPDGHVDRFIATSRDVTELRLLQTKIIHISRLNAMAAMATTLAHELNQPLAAIVNYAAGAENLIARGAKSSELSYPISEIGKNAERAGEIIRRLREMTRKGVITKEVFIPDPVILEAAKLAQVGACTDINLRFEFADGKPVLGDPIQIQQVLIKLIRNACEAVRDCREPDVLVRTLLVGNETLISVEDSGRGIPPDDLPALFDSFFTTKDDGMGVGLSISRTIIEAHQGKIWAENRPEGGSRFSFTLPLADTPAADNSRLK